MSKLSKPWFAHQQRQLSAIYDYTADIQHIAIKGNSAADAFSCAPTCPHTYLASITEGLDYEVMATTQQTNDKIRAYRTAITSLYLQDVHFDSYSTTLLCDVSTEKLWRIVPSAWCKKIFDFHTQVLKSLGGCCQVNLSGMVWPSKLGIGRRPASPINRPRSINTPKYSSITMNHLRPG